MNSCRDRILAAVRADFLNCLSNGHYTIEHKVDVHKTIGEGGEIDYKNEDLDYRVKSARFSSKINKDGGIESKVKIVIE